MFNGVVICDKPKDFTSHDVIGKLRGIIKQKKIGHGGTLDPFATGVLPIFLGNATRASQYVVSENKEYIATVKLGIVTDTQDITGKILQKNNVCVSLSDMKDILTKFSGDILQTPPMYSAISINGKRLYDLARSGINVDRPARKIHIEKLEILSNLANDEFKVRVVCSKGTYIRTLCHDIGQALGCGATVSALRRTKVGLFDECDALTIAEIERLATTGQFDTAVIPTEKLFAHLPKVNLGESIAFRAKNGCPFYTSSLPDCDINSFVRVYDENGTFFMLGSIEQNENSVFKISPEKMFL